MAKKCIPGVICIEHITAFLLMIFISIFVYYSKPRNIMIKNNIDEYKIIDTNNNSNDRLFTRPNYAYSNRTDDILLNPYQAPLRDDRFFIKNNIGTRGMSINIETQSVDTPYRQVGILKKINGGDTILPLMGRPLFANRDKWNFYTINENNIKLPLTFKQKSCTNEYGCDNIYNGDNVYVDGIDSIFKATIYDNAIIRYLPF